MTFVVGGLPGLIGASSFSSSDVVGGVVEDIIEEIG